MIFGHSTNAAFATNAGGIMTIDDGGGSHSSWRRRRWRRRRRRRTRCFLHPGAGRKHRERDEHERNDEEGEFHRNRSHCNW